MVAGETEAPYATGGSNAVVGESGVVSQLLNRRHASLYPSKFMTYRKESDESPSKVWPIVAGMALGDVEGSNFRVRHAKASTLWAVTAHAYDEKRMWSFSVAWPQSGVLGQDTLVVAFEEEAEARRWHDAFSGAIAGAPPAPEVTARARSRTASDRERNPAAAPGGAARAGGPAPLREASGQGDSLGGGSAADEDTQSGTGESGAGPALPEIKLRAAGAEGPGRPARPAQPPSPFASPRGDVGDAGARVGVGAPPSPGSSPSKPPPLEAPHADERPSRQARWESVHHVNGASVFVEAGDEATGRGGGALLVSTVVKATPADVYRHLVADRAREGLGLLWGARTVKRVDESAAVVAQTWRPEGLTAAACAPREVVLLRTSRRDENGTYIVLFQSTTHGRAARPPSTTAAARPASWWYRPVRMEVEAAGFTVAPLLPRYLTQGESRESLLTLVVKADPGGYLSSRSRVFRAAGVLQPLLARSFLEALVGSLITLRERVEQDRFVLRPLSRDEDAGALETPQPGAAAPSSAEARRAMLARRTASSLSFSAPSLLEAQRSVARDRLHRAGELGGGHDAAGPAAGGQGPVGPSALPTVAEEPDARGEGGEEGAPGAGGPPEGGTRAPPPGGAAGEEGGEGTSAAEDLDSAWAIPGTLQHEFWSSPGTERFVVRGGNYLSDRKKIPAGPPAFELVAVDLLKLDEPVFHVARYLPSVRQSPAPFLLTLQLMVPSSPPISLVASWASPVPVLGVSAGELADSLLRIQEPGGGASEDAVRAFANALSGFVAGDDAAADAARNKSLKLIPRIAKGSWIIQKSVGTTPALLGQKLSTKYYRGARYLEVDVDLGSSTVAASIVNMVLGATRSLTIDLAILIEGKTKEQLPEQLLGTIRLDALDTRTAAYLDDSTGNLIRQE